MKTSTQVEAHPPGGVRRPTAAPGAEFLRDGLDSVDSETVKLKLISPLRPAVLEGESDDYVYLIMPIRLAG